MKALTPRDVEIREILLQNDLSIKKTAEILGISYKALTSHLHTEKQCEWWMRQKEIKKAWVKKKRHRRAYLRRLEKAGVSVSDYPEVQVLTIYQAPED